MKDRRLVLGVTLALIALPVVLVPIQAVSFHVRNPSNGSIVSSGKMRDYLLYVPAGYDRSRPTPGACRCPSGWAAPPATGLTPRARCGHSFVSIGFVLTEE